MKKMILLVLPLLAACSSRPARVAPNVFGMTFPADARPQTSANLRGYRTEEQLFSWRLDSRTFFAHDRRAAAGPRFAGSDARLLELATALLRRAGVPAAEIDAPRVLQEQLQHARVDRAARRVLQMEPATSGTRIAHVSRRIGRVPVFSSRLVLTVGADERPAFAELHWPEIPAEVVAEAGRLQRIVAGGWQPPAHGRARAESVEAGIVHSPAASFVMDVAPVIRVVYAGADGGKKPMLFYDANGRLVAPPRTFVSAPPRNERARTVRR